MNSVAQVHNLVSNDRQLNIHSILKKEKFQQAHIKPSWRRIQEHGSQLFVPSFITSSGRHYRANVYMPKMYSFKECCICIHLPCLQKEYHSSQTQCQYILHNRNSPLPIQSKAIIFGGLLFMMGPSQLSRIFTHGTIHHVSLEVISKLNITKRNSYTQYQ